MNSTWGKYKKKTLFLLTTLVVSIFFAVFFQPIINEKALDILVNIYSILAGFLIGVIALIGDPASMPVGSWRIAEAATKNTFRRLAGTRNLLYVYLITLFLIFMYKLLSVAALTTLLQPYINTTDSQPYLSSFKKWTELFILFFACIAFSYSFKLPAVLFKIQQSRVKKEIENRRTNANIKK